MLSVLILYVIMLSLLRLAASALSSDTTDSISHDEVRLEVPVGCTTGNTLMNTNRALHAFSLVPKSPG